MTYHAFLDNSFIDMHWLGHLIAANKLVYLNMIRGSLHLKIYRLSVMKLNLIGDFFRVWYRFREVGHGITILYSHGML